MYGIGYGSIQISIWSKLSNQIDTTPWFCPLHLPARDSILLLDMAVASTFQGCEQWCWPPPASPMARRTLCPAAWRSWVSALHHG
jgi:hypothetical protein